MEKKDEEDEGSCAITPQVVERDDFRTTYPEHQQHVVINEGPPERWLSIDARFSVPFHKKKEQPDCFTPSTIVIVNHLTFIFLSKLENLDSCSSPFSMYDGDKQRSS